MKDNLTEIAFVLDRSASMQEGDKAGGAIEGFNRLVTEQARQPGEARMTLILFDHEYLVEFDRMAIGRVPLLDNNTYVPRGNTALYDAIGKTIDDVGARLAAEPEAERPGKVIVAILTDGEENSSHLYRRERIGEMIQHQQEVYGWEFLFLSSELKAIADAVALNVPLNNAMSFEGTDEGVRDTFRITSENMSRMRNQP